MCLCACALVHVLLHAGQIGTSCLHACVYVRARACVCVRGRGRGRVCTPTRADVNTCAQMCMHTWLCIYLRKEMQVLMPLSPWCLRGLGACGALVPAGFVSLPVTVWAHASVCAIACVHIHTSMHSCMLCSAAVSSTLRAPPATPRHLTCMQAYVPPHMQVRTPGTDVEVHQGWAGICGWGMFATVITGLQQSFGSIIAACAVLWQAVMVSHDNIAFEAASVLKYKFKRACVHAYVRMHMRMRIPVRMCMLVHMRACVLAMSVRTCACARVRASTCVHPSVRTFVCLRPCTPAFMDPFVRRHIRLHCAV